MRCFLAFISLWLCIFGYAAGQTADSGSRRVALVIGNDTYQVVRPLEKARNDATAMARSLASAGFDVTLERDLNYRNMVKKIDAFTSKIIGGDQVVVFFAGHGVQLKSGSYLLPTDIEATSESEIEKTSYALNDLLEKLNDAKASFTLVMVDACRDNPLKANGRALGGNRGLSPIEPPKGQMVVYSASKGQQALDKLSDHDANPNGVFTREFVARMKKPGLRIEELVREVQDSVEQLARTVNHEQRPAIYNESRGNFYFFGHPSVLGVSPQVAPATAPTALPSAIQLQARTKEQIEDGVWDSIKDTNDLESFEEYLRQYPRGRYVAQARIAITRVKSDAKRANGVQSTSPVFAMPVAPAVDAETALWGAVERGNSAEDYLAYLQKYPGGSYAALAKSRLTRLQTKSADRIPNSYTDSVPRQEIRGSTEKARCTVLLNRLSLGEILTTSEKMEYSQLCR